MSAARKPSTPLTDALGERFQHEANDDLGGAFSEALDLCGRLEADRARLVAALHLVDQADGGPWDGEEQSRHVAHALANLRALLAEIDGLRAFKRSVDEALNSGDGSYRP